MRINNNLMAMNAHRQLGINAANQSKSTEKLSSGFRINRAGDDAAGLAISEKMRGQIRGLNQASRNAQDGISLIQTAEGALDTSQKILQRMRELSVQAANDTNVDADREAIQNEITELTKEVDRIANTAEFNTQKLLKGTGELDLKGLGVDFDNGKLTGGTDMTTTEATVSNPLDAHDIAATDSITATIHGQTVTVNFAVDTTQAETSKIGDVTGNNATITVNAADIDAQDLEAVIA
ncbi:MAG: flagellin protein, partial [Clostridiales bacterium]